MCASACVATRHTTGMAPRAIPAASARIVRPVSWRTSTTVSAAAPDASSALSRFIRNAASPKGWSTIEASQPSSA